MSAAKLLHLLPPTKSRAHGAKCGAHVATVEARVEQNQIHSYEICHVVFRLLTVKEAWQSMCGHLHQA